MCWTYPLFVLSSAGRAPLFGRTGHVNDLRAVSWPPDGRAVSGALCPAVSGALCPAATACRANRRPMMRRDTVGQPPRRGAA